ncbi:hypothetical protein CEXT_601701 [Caerostris extrusa]|uniref:Uncharacterized protein n=1 Tax=Caerostris extrusa TaxID=172846 RepID=A0AAV4MLF0_CAEEX|nr:hypothetical protein CEXT_601701 [Caerostris extrusa]
MFNQGKPPLKASIELENVLRRYLPNYCEGIMNKTETGTMQCTDLLTQLHKQELAHAITGGTRLVATGRSSCLNNTD